MTLLGDLIDLVLPRHCVGCRQPAASYWCTECRGQPIVRRCADGPGAGVWAAADYGGSVREALLHYKERGLRSLRVPLAELLLAALEPLLNGAGEVAVVPVTSTRSAARARGGDHMLSLGRVLVVSASSRALVLRPVLRVKGSVADSAGLSAQQRRSRRAVLVAQSPSRGESRRVVLIDDIVTTGATLASANDALTDAGWQVEGAAVIAATRLRSSTASALPLPSLFKAVSTVQLPQIGLALP